MNYIPDVNSSKDGRKYTTEIRMELRNGNTLFKTPPKAMSLNFMTCMDM